MNRVGHEGRGESIWLGWFLCATLKGFAKVCRDRGDETARARYMAHISTLSKSLEANAWDGDWYLRAFFDDGSKLGSASNSECRIDSIAQSWALISGAGDRTRSAHAMRQVEEHLLRPGDGLVLLFTPPFDQGVKDPGYIKGYVPGVRENGGQYTHAAIWAMMAFAELGNGDKAAELFELSIPSTIPPREPVCTSTKWSHMSSRRMCMRSRHTPDEEAGPGTPAQPPGCIEPGSNRSLASSFGENA
jgi:cyclic beta-1,2-glucan synthetase